MREKVIAWGAKGARRHWASYEGVNSAYGPTHVYTLGSTLTVSPKAYFYIDAKRFVLSGTLLHLYTAFVVCDVTHSWTNLAWASRYSIDNQHHAFFCKYSLTWPSYIIYISQDGSSEYEAPTWYMELPHWWVSRPSPLPCQVGELLPPPPKRNLNTA